MNKPELDYVELLIRLNAALPPTTNGHYIEVKPNTNLPILQFVAKGKYHHITLGGCDANSTDAIMDTILDYVNSL